MERSLEDLVLIAVHTKGGATFDITDFTYKERSLLIKILAKLKKKKYI